MKHKLLTFGLGGTVITLLCCFTPILPIVLTTLGLTWAISIVYTDVVLLPILAGFIALTIYALWVRNNRRST